MAKRATMVAMLHSNGALAPLASIFGCAWMLACSNGGTVGGTGSGSDCDQLTPYCVEGFCWDGRSGDPCAFNSDCNVLSPYCVFPDDCSDAAPFCPDASMTCTDGSDGDPCTFGSECQDGLACENDVCIPA